MAMYVCPKPDPKASVEATQMRATISMQQADKLPMSDCTGMPDAMDSEAPQLCHAHCSGDRQSALSWQGLDIQFLAAHVMWLANSLPGLGLCWLVSLAFAGLMLAAAWRIAGTRSRGDLL